MNIYNTGNRQGLLTALSDVRKALEAEEVEPCEMTDSTITKLEAMTDEGFDKLAPFPDFDESSDGFFANWPIYLPPIVGKALKGS